MSVILLAKCVHFVLFTIWPAILLSFSKLFSVACWLNEKLTNCTTRVLVCMRPPVRGCLEDASLSMVWRQVTRFSFMGNPTTPLFRYNASQDCGERGSIFMTLADFEQIPQMILVKHCLKQVVWLYLPERRRLKISLVWFSFDHANF